MKPGRGGWIVALLAMLATLTAGGCGEPADDRNPGPRLIDETSLEIVETITVDHTGFAPDEITVTAGDGLELVNEGVEPHGFDGGEEFGTGLLEPGERSTLVLPSAGDYPYVDPADPDNEGLIVVEADPDDPGSGSRDD
jgi:plastocyanin